MRYWIIGSKVNSKRKSLKIAPRVANMADILRTQMKKTNKCVTDLISIPAFI